MTIPEQKSFVQEARYLRTWMISLLVLAAALLISAIAEWSHRPPLLIVEEELNH